MTFMTRARLALVQWWIRNVKERSSRPFPDFEGMGRSLLRPLESANLLRPVPPALSVDTRDPVRGSPNRNHLLGSRLTADPRT